MNIPSDAPLHPTSPARIRWSIAGEPTIHHGTLEDVRSRPPGELVGATATLVSSDLAKVGDELRVELAGEPGASIAVGLARVRSVDPVIGMSVELLALGTDPRVLAVLGAAPSEPSSESHARPPALPGKIGGPPPLRLDRPAALPREERESIAPIVEPLAVKKRGIVIGIDLGTTNTCASYVVDGRAVVIPGRTGTSTIPSMITFDPDGAFHIGQRAADRQVLHPTRTVYGSKRLLGRTYRPELAAQLQAHFAYPLAEAEGQRFGVRIDDRVVSMDTIAARVLDEVRGSAEAYLKQPIEAAIITVPAYFSEVQREAVRRAAAQAKLTVYRIVNEPTAAAVAYGHKQEKDARIAVWDFGGGTFDFSIVDVSAGQLEVVATGGDNFVGGSDLDDIVASHLLAEFRRHADETFEPDAQQIARLRDAADHAKRALSVETETMIEVRELTRAPKRDLRVQLTREQFETLIAPLVERTIAITREVMQASGIEVSQIDDVVLVGGTTRVPAVQQAVAAFFGRRPSKRINPDEAVALGAALLADEIGAGAAPTLLDILPMSIGRGLPSRRFEPIVPRNSRVPATRELTVDADILGSVYVPLFQGESTDVAGNEYLCSVLVEDRALWDGGRVTLRLAFDEHCVMTIEAIDARTGKSLVAQLDRSRPVEDVLRDLGVFEGPSREAWHLPETALGKVLGKLFKLFGR